MADIRIEEMVYQGREHNVQLPNQYQNKNHYIDSHFQSKLDAVFHLI